MPKFHENASEFRETTDPLCCKDCSTFFKYNTRSGVIGGLIDQKPRQSATCSGAQDVRQLPDVSFEQESGSKQDRGLRFSMLAKQAYGTEFTVTVERGHCRRT